MSFCTPITSVSNTLEKIYFGRPIGDEFTSDYYNENNGDFALLFEQYIYSDVDNIYRTSTAIEWKAKMYE